MLKKLIGSAILLLLSLCYADAARLASTASGNIDATGTWSVIDATSYLNSQTGNTALNATNGTSSAFTPGAVTISGVWVKLATRTNSSGTIKIELVIAGVSVPGTAVTVNCADLVSSATTTTAEGGWVAVSFPNVLLVAATVYNIKITTASSCNMAFWTDGTANNWSRALVTTATQVNGPAAGDQFFVMGSLTGAGTHVSNTVTVETTANINYGNVANTLVDPSISIGQFGTLAFANSASTAYKMQWAGPAVNYNGGTFTIGTAGSPIPATSTATLTLNATVAEDTGLANRNGSTFKVTGVSGGRNVTKTLLTSTATAASTTVLATADTTGWLSGDFIVIAGTTRTPGSSAAYKEDTATLGTNAGTLTVTLPGAVTNTHEARQIGYTSSNTGVAYAANLYPAIINITRNVVIQGSGTTTNAWMTFAPTSTGAIDWTEFTMISGRNAGFRGLEVDTGPSGSFTLTNSSFYNTSDSTLILSPSNTTFGGTQGAYVNIQHVVMYKVTTTSATGVTLYGLGQITCTFNPYWTIDDLTMINSANNSGFAFPVKFFVAIHNFTNSTFSGNAQASQEVVSYEGCYSQSQNIGGGIGNTWANLEFYSNTNTGPYFNNRGNPLNGTITGLKAWREPVGFKLDRNGILRIENFYSISSGFGLYFPSAAADITVTNGIMAADSGGGQSGGVIIDGASSKFRFDNVELCPIGTLGGFVFTACTGTSAVVALVNDVNVTGGNTPGYAQVWLNNSSLLNNNSDIPTPHGMDAFFSKDAFVVQDCSGCTIKHGALLLGGYNYYDTAITHVSGYSLRMTPRINTYQGWIVPTPGTTTGNLTLTSASATYAASIFIGGGPMASDCAGFIPGTTIYAGSGPYTVSHAQTVCSSGAPGNFQTYSNFGSLPRLNSAPANMGVQLAVASGQTARACVWIRTSLNTDAGPLFGGSGVTYNGDAPRMLVRSNPMMGVQSDTVLGTLSASAGVWTQLCADLPVAPRDGQYELVIDADQTLSSNPGGWINIAEWSCTAACGDTSSGRYWWNGIPSQFIAAPGRPNTLGL